MVEDCILQVRLGKKYEVQGSMWPMKYSCGASIAYLDPRRFLFLFLHFSYMSAVYIIFNAVHCVTVVLIQL